MTEEQITSEAYSIGLILDDVFLETLQDMGELIRYIGEKKDIQYVDALKEVADITNTMKNNLKPALLQTMKEINALLEESALDTFYETAKALGQAEIDPYYINHYVFPSINQYKGIIENNLINIANTTVVNKQYVQAVNKACILTATKTEDYNTAIRKTVKQMTQKSSHVQYESGVTRRVDSAVRMNIQDGVRRINEDVREQAGREFGADAYEISAHALCANDHLHIQGKQYSIEEFDYVNSNLKRKLATCNCRHIKFPIILGVSEPNYSKEEIKKYNAYSTKVVTVNGREMTRYEASQYMRQIETAIRQNKEYAIAGKACGDTELTRVANRKVKSLLAMYKQAGADSGLTLQYERTFVPRY